MDEYIARSYIRKMAMLEMAYTMETETDAAVVLRMIDDAPAADVAPVVHGRWMKRRNGGTLCSRCGHYTQYKGQVLDMSEAIACPWCGAKMDGGADHEAD